MLSNSVSSMKSEIRSCFVLEIIFHVIYLKMGQINSQGIGYLQI